MKYLLGLALWFCVIASSGQQYRIAIISDFDQTPALESVVNQMIREIDQTTGTSKKILLESISYGINEVDQAKIAYTTLSVRSDIIISLGSVSAKGLSSISDLSIPVIALGIVDPQLQGISYSQGKSGKKNFSYILQTKNLEKELQAFSKIHNFHHLAVFADEKSVSIIDTEKSTALIDSISNKLKAEISIIRVGASFKQALEQLPINIDGAYFTNMLTQSESELRQLINELNQRKIPTFTGNSRLLDFGVLGSLTNENNLQQVVRKLAIMVDGAANGDDLSKMYVGLDVEENFYVNIETARKINLSIPFEVLFTASLIGDTQSEIKTYSFEEIAEKSIEANLNIQISYQDIAISRQDVKQVKANLLPSLNGGLTASQINDERANALFNSPERSLTGDLTLNQIIYSEQAIAGLKISQYLLKAQEYSTEAEVLGILLDTYSAYLNILSAKTNVLIQQENLQNTKKNKELAEIRVNIGSSNNADLFRWESEVALATQAVVEAQAGLMTTKLQLDNLLANKLESAFDVVDVSLQDEWFASMSQSPFSKMVKTPESLKVLSDFLVTESQDRNPGKKSLIENINATDRQLTQNKRLLYVPTVALQAQTSQFLARGGAGSTINEQQSQFLGTNEFQDNSWFVGVSLSYPIFSGFGRKASIQQSKVSMDQLDNSKTLLDQNLELGIRATVFNLLSAGTNIRFSQEASRSAEQNFGLVQENYKQGQVTITQLIDAQEAALQARLAAALSIYEYIQTHLQLEFNIGAFTMLMPDDQLQDFNNRLQEYLNNQN